MVETAPTNSKLGKIVSGQLRQIEASYPTIIENLSSGVALIQKKRIIFANSALCKMIGYNSEALINLEPQGIKKLIYYKDREKVWNIIDKPQAVENLKSPINVRINRKNGELRWLEISINMINSRRGLILQLTTIDISAKKKSEEQLLHSQKMATMSQLANGFAHQVNTPLAVVSSRLQILEEDLKKAGHTMYLQNVSKVLENSDKISSIITRLVTFLRQSQDKKITIDINKLLTEITTFINSSANKKNINIFNDLIQNLPTVKVFQNKLEQVFMNIIINAFEAMPEGGSIKITSKIVKRIGPFIEISFTDTGKGMIKEVKDNLFKPFYSTKPVSKASGLGMFISYCFIKEHNGHIIVKSKKNHGTEIKVYLPVTG